MCCDDSALVLCICVADMLVSASSCDRRRPIIDNKKLPMRIPRVRVTNTHWHKIDEIARLGAPAGKPCARQTLTAVVMTLRGIPAETIAQAFGCSRVCVWRYVDRWNSEAMEAAMDHRGGRQDSFTEDMLRDIDDATGNRSLKDDGYYKNR